LGSGIQKTSDDYGPVAEINITPLVDVMLVLLVIFMVTAPLLEQGIALELPKVNAKTLPQGDKKTISLQVSKDGKIFLDRREIDKKNLTTELQVLFPKKSNHELLVRADSSLPYGYVAAVIGTAKQVGIHRIGLATSPEDNARKRD